MPSPLPKRVARTTPKSRTPGSCSALPDEHQRPGSFRQAAAGLVADADMRAVLDLDGDRRGAVVNPHQRLLARGIAAMALRLLGCRNADPVEAGCARVAQDNSLGQRALRVRCLIGNDANRNALCRHGY